MGSETAKAFRSDMAALALAMGLVGCTSEYRAFCEMFVSCHEAFVGTTVQNCVTHFENYEAEDAVERERCKAELAEAAEASHCGPFSERDPCTLCTPELMSPIVTLERNSCGVARF